MFKFQRVMSGGNQWTDNLFIEDAQIGTIGLDEKGLYVNVERDLSLKEINLLIAQLTINNPSLLDKKVEFIKFG